MSSTGNEFRKQMLCLPLQQPWSVALSRLRRIAKIESHYFPDAPSHKESTLGKKSPLKENALAQLGAVTKILQSAQ